MSERPYTLWLKKNKPYGNTLWQYPMTLWKTTLCVKINPMDPIEPEFYGECNQILFVLWTMN